VGEEDNGCRFIECEWEREKFYEKVADYQVRRRRKNSSDDGWGTFNCHWFW
jgi:hypothetical protein